MSTKSPSELEADETAQKRAQWEQFSFRVEAPGMVDVTNESHDTPADHQYVVTLDDVTGEAMACTCPHHVHRSAFCKHMTAVETATDDGTLDVFLSEDDEEDEETDETDEDDAAPAECDCDGLNGFPCWPCVRARRKELPN
ncbi:SWIM zinc finger family protein [Haladaptatus salinisoli]|uniref:SWIM zinc finger family protein n=1 Tax=Haladaptatus salinisoli TaxID=2884876 RepID=UPI001D0AE7A4|nr:SWIM zinc finger family protein [Haladaptatus salinisoli]